MPEFHKPPPLNIKCTSADCDNDLHCFKQLKRMTDEQRGKCRYCGAQLVDWDRLHVRDFADVEYTFAALKNEMIRHYFFHREVDERALRHAQRKGRIRLKEDARHRLGKHLAVAQPARDGRQTPVPWKRDFLRSARNGHMLPDMSRILAQHSEGQGIDRRRAGLLHRIGRLLSGRTATGIGGDAHQSAKHATSSAPSLVNAGAELMKHHETVDATPRELTSTQTAAPNPTPSHQRNAAH